MIEHPNHIQKMQTSGRTILNQKYNVALVEFFSTFAKTLATLEHVQQIQASDTTYNDQ